MDVKRVDSRNPVSRKQIEFAMSERSSRQAKQVEEEHGDKTRKQQLTEDLTESLSNILLGEKIPLDVVNVEIRRNYHSGKPQDHKDLAAETSAAHHEPCRNRSEPDSDQDQGHYQ